MEELTEEGRRLRRDLKAEQRRARTASRALPGLDIEEWVKEVACCLFVLAGYTATRAVSFLTSKLKHAYKHSRQALPSGEELTALVEQWFVDTSRELDESSERGETRRRAKWTKARKFLLGDRAFRWTMGLNADKGVAPTTSEVLRFCAGNGDEALSRVQAQELPGTDVRLASNRMWARRWRVTFGMKIGKIRLRESISVEEKKVKAILGKTGLPVSEKPRFWARP